MDPELKELFAKVAKTQNELAKAHKETETTLQDYIKESRASLDEYKKESRASLDEYKKESRASLDEYKKESRASLDEYKKENEKGMKKLRQELARVGLASGDIAEDLFRRNVDVVLKKRGLIFDIIIPNAKISEREYDIVGINGSNILVVETKNRLNKSYIDHFIKKQLPFFKKHYLGSPYFKDYLPQDNGIIAGLAALAVSHDIEKYAEERGLFVFTQNKEGGASIANSDSFKAKVF